MSDEKKTNVSDEQLEQVTGGAFKDVYTDFGGNKTCWQCTHPLAMKDMQNIDPRNSLKCKYFENRQGEDRYGCCQYCKYFSLIDD